MLAVNDIFTDSKKANRAAPSDIMAAFGTNDLEKVAEDIVKHGEIQLTTEFKRRKTEEKKKQIAAFISKNAVNPQTKMPHPPERIIAAMEQAHVSIDPFKSADSQVEDIMKEIKKVIPISVEEMTLFIEIPVAYAARAYSVVKEFGIQQEKWLADGSFVAKVTIPVAMKETIYRRLGNATEGSVRIEEGK